MHIFYEYIWKLVYYLSYNSNLTVLANRIRSVFVFKRWNCLYEFFSRRSLCSETSRNSFQFSNDNICSYDAGVWQIL